MIQNSNNTYKGYSVFSISQSKKKEIFAFIVADLHSDTNNAEMHQIIITRERVFTQRLPINFLLNLQLQII